MTTVLAIGLEFPDIPYLGTSNITGHSNHDGWDVFVRRLGGLYKGVRQVGPLFRPHQNNSKSCGEGFEALTTIRDWVPPPKSKYKGRPDGSLNN